MARLRRDGLPAGLRLRMAEILRDRYGPPPSHRHKFDDGLMWQVAIRDQVDALLSGAPVELSGWELPRDVQDARGIRTYDRLRLVGNDLVMVEADNWPRARP